MHAGVWVGVLTASPDRGGVSDPDMGGPELSMGSRSRQSAKHWACQEEATVWKIRSQPIPRPPRRRHSFGLACFDGDVSTARVWSVFDTQLRFRQLFVLPQGKVLVAVRSTPFQPHFDSDQPYPGPPRFDPRAAGSFRSTYLTTGVF